jgi:hypothetical protein
MGEFLLILKKQRDNMAAKSRLWEKMADCRKTRTAKIT